MTAPAHFVQNLLKTARGAGRFLLKTYKKVRF